MGAPWLLAFGLQADGWYWRSTSIWHKPNALPESVTDRPVVGHSYVLQFAKSRRYFWDSEAVREPAEWARWGDQTVVKEQQGKGGWIPAKTKQELYDELKERRRGTDEYESRGLEAGRRFASETGGLTHPNGRSLRSVWTIPTQGYPEAHFATWPTKLAERILLMACPEQVCRVCGKARERIVEKQIVATRGKVGPSIKPHGIEDAEAKKVGARADKGSNFQFSAAVYGRYDVKTLDFTDCGHSDYRPGIVLDPFVGSGTTMWVARKLGRRAIGIDLSAEYLALAAKRLAQQSLLAVEA